MKGKALLLFGMLSGSLVLGVLFFRLGYENTWRLWNIPTMPLPFGDLRAITGASESLASDLDPLVTNPGDPWGRTVNYPRVWLLLSARVDQSDTVSLGIILVTLFLVGILLSTSRSLDKTSAALLVISVFSPAVLFGVERGNTDLLVFFLLAVAIYFSNRGGVAARAGSMASVLLAFALKLYPVCAFAFLLREGRRTFHRLSIGAAVLVGLYVALTYRDLLLIYQHTPRAEDLAFGIDVWAGRLFPLIGTGLRIPTYAALVAGLFLALPPRMNGSDASNLIQAEDVREGSLDAFRMGSGIYIGTFLLGSNFDYKLVFLLLTLPQLVSWARSAIRPMSLTARWALVGIIVSIWAPLLREPLALLPTGSTLGFMLDELANWAVFYGLAFLLASSAPKWMKDDVNRLLRIGTTRRASFIILTFASALLAVGALAYLALLPSDLAHAILGRYSLARLILMSGPLIMALASSALLARGIRDREWASRVADRVYDSRGFIQRLGAYGYAVAAVLLVLLMTVRPEWVERVTPVTIQRLLPCFVLPSSLVLLYWLTDRIAQTHGPQGAIAFEGPAQSKDLG